MWTPLVVEGAGFGSPRTPPVEGKGRADIAQLAGRIKAAMAGEPVPPVSSGAMRASPSVHLRLAIVLCVIVGLYDIVYTIALNFSDQRIGAALRPVVQRPTYYPDFITPYGAVQAFLQGKLAIVYDHSRFTALLNELYDIRPRFILQPFLYPPVWLLMLLPIGLLPVGPSCLLFMLATAAAWAFERRRDPWGWLIAATSPAAVWVVLSGQNTFLYVALIYGGLRLAERSPALAGLLLGCLVYKPQICLLVPLALLASRQWRVLGWMIATGGAWVLASVAVFGLDFWLAYVDMARHLGQPPMLDVWASRRSTFNISPFVAARILNLPDGAASALQLGAALLGAVAVWFAFRRHAASAARTAVLMAATLLVSPYAINYDMLLLLPAAIVLFRESAARGLHPLEPPIYLAIWLMPTAMLWFNYRLPVAPLAILAFGLYALRRLSATKDDAEVQREVHQERRADA